MPKVEVFDALQANKDISAKKLDGEGNVRELCASPRNQIHPNRPTNENGERTSSRKMPAMYAALKRTYELNHGGKHLAESIHKLWELDHLCDVILSVDNTTFKAHRVVLAACSGYFYDHFITEDKTSAVSELPFSKLPLTGSRSDVMRKINRAIYSSKITLDSSCVGDILTAASFLRIPSIVDACQSYLGNTLCIENCIRNLKIATLHKLEFLLEETYKFISSNFKDVSKQAKFNELNVMEMIALIKRQDVVADFEIEIFNPVVKWIEHDKINRAQYIGIVMKHVRFGLMTKNQLVDNVEGCRLALQCSELNDYIKEAIRYHLLPFRRSVLQSQRTIPRSTFTMDVAVACGGMTANGNCWTTTGNIFYYDAKDNTWLPFAELPEPRHHHAVATLGNFLYIAGGTFGLDEQNSSRKAWRYDPYGETWLRIANMLQPRQTFQIEALDSRLYAVGGRNDSCKVLSSVERYNPSTNAWSIVESISPARRYVALASAGGRLYAVGGLGNDTVSRTVESFNPVSSRWEKRCALPKPRFGGALHTVNENLWLIGGATVVEKGRVESVVPTKSIEIYSPGTDQWTTVVSRESFSYALKNNDESSITGADGEILQTYRTEPGSCVVSDEIFLVTGFTGSKSSLLKDVELLNVSAISEKFLPALRSATQQRLGEDRHQNGHNVKAANPKPANYPHRCTGVACATLKLYKKPNKSQSSAEEVPVDTETRNYQGVEAGRSRKSTGWNSSDSRYI